MNIDQLEAFLYVVQLKSVHKASQALFLAQPTVTARIKTLERELNTDLFVRNNRNLTLSDKGKEFLPYAKEIMQSYRYAKNNLSKSSTENEIIIGANVITSQYVIPAMLSKWIEAHPKLKFRFISATNDELIQKLRNDELDFAFTRATSIEKIIQEPILDNSIKLIVYPNHPFIKDQTLTVHKLAKEPLVFFECGAFDWNMIYKLFEVEQVQPNINLNVDHLEVAKSLIKAKQCIGFLPILAVKEELAKGELVEIDTTYLVNINQHIFLSYSKTDGVSVLRDIITQTVEQFYRY